MDQNLLAALQIAFADQRLPGRQRHQRQRGGLFVAETFWLVGGIGRLDPHEFGKRARLHALRPRKHGVAHFETGHVFADGRHHTRDIIANHVGHGQRQHSLEVTSADEVVHRVYAGGMHLDHQAVGQQGWLRDIGDFDLRAVGFDNGCFHR